MNSIGIEIEPQYCALAERWLSQKLKALLGDTNFEFAMPVRFSQPKAVAVK
jgi:hypothetical protein